MIHEATDRHTFLEYISLLIPENSTCVEVGVERGFFSKMILDKLNPGLLYLVDPWEVGSDKNSTERYYVELDNIEEEGYLPTAYSDEEMLGGIGGRPMFDGILTGLERLLT